MKKKMNFLKKLLNYKEKVNSPFFGLFEFQSELRSDASEFFLRSKSALSCSNMIFKNNIDHHVHIYHKNEHHVRTKIDPNGVLWHLEVNWMTFFVHSNFSKFEKCRTEHDFQHHVRRTWYPNMKNMCGTWCLNMMFFYRINIKLHAIEKY